MRRFLRILTNALSFLTPSLPPSLFPYLHSPPTRIMPNQSVNLGYLISGPAESAVKMGDFEVTGAEWCEEAK